MNEQKSKILFGYLHQHHHDHDNDDHHGNVNVFFIYLHQPSSSERRRRRKKTAGDDGIKSFEIHFWFHFVDDVDVLLSKRPTMEINYIFIRIERKTNFFYALNK